MGTPLTGTTMIGIIGGGAASMSCALWLKQLGLNPVIIDQNAELGGQLLNLKRVNRWVLGEPDKTSAELAGQYSQHIRQLAIDCQLQSQLRHINATASGFNVGIEHKGKLSQFDFKALVIASGVRVLGPEAFSHLPGFVELSESHDISFFPTAHIDLLAGLANKTVAVIGGGDNAHFTAKDLALAGAHVYLLIRNLPNARPVIRSDVLELIAQGKITEYLGAQIRRFGQGPQGLTITLQNGGTLQADKIFPRLGFAANTEFLDDFSAFQGIEKTRGYIVTTPNRRSSIPWVYAIGDAANPQHQSVVNAIAEGAIAAQDLSERV
jgi:thioredoxin reductase (NADPH)